MSKSTLADDFMWKLQHDREYTTDRTRAAYIKHMTEARRFVFDAEASQRLAEIDNAMLPLLWQQLDFAVPPYEKTWIEIDFKAFSTVANNRTFSQDSALRLGYFIVGDEITPILDANMDPVPSPFTYVRGNGMTVQEQLDFCELTSISRIGIDQGFWGKAYNVIPKEAGHALRDRYSISINLPTWMEEEKAYKWLESRKGAYANAFQESAGELRLINLILLLLNRPSNYTYVEVPRGKGFKKGKLRPYAAHNKVVIDITAPQKIKEVPRGINTEPSRHHRRHEVRPMWCHDRVARENRARCGIHAWVPWVQKGDPATNEPPRKFKCSRCGGKRWHRRAHERGDASLGFVTKEYVVTAGNRK